MCCGPKEEECPCEQGVNDAEEMLWWPDTSLTNESVFLVWILKKIVFNSLWLHVKTNLLKSRAATISRSMENESFKSSLPFPASLM